MYVYSRDKPSFRVRTETETQTTDVWTRRKGGREKGREKSIIAGDFVSS